MGPGIFLSPRPQTGAARRRRVALACACLAAAVSAPAVAGPTIASAYTSASVIDASSIVRVDDMVFGQIVQPSAPGTVVLTAAAAGPATCTVTGGLVRTGICKAAHFSVSGRHGKSIKMREEDGGSIVLTGPGGATMTVTDFSIAVLELSGRTGAAGWNFGSWNVDSASGIADFWVGGTLHVATSQAPGTYVGTLDLRIQAN
jgi:uncharacterized protein DUF4402